MASGMDKGLMALMGIDDIGQDEGLVGRTPDDNGSSFFDNDSDLDSDEDKGEDTGKNKDKDEDAHVETTPLSVNKTYTQHSRTNAISEDDDTLLTPRASTSSLFASSSTSKSKEPSPSSSLFAQDYNPFSVGSSAKVRVPKSKKKTKSSGASSMFSPTLNPRKIKKASAPTSLPNPVSRSPPSTQGSQSQSSSTSMDVRVASLSPPPQSRMQRDSEKDALVSPMNSFVLKKKVIAFSDSEDSDISPLEDNSTLSLSTLSRRNIALNASFTSDADMDMDMDMDMPSSKRSYTKTASDAAMNGFFDDISDSDGDENKKSRQKQNDSIDMATDEEMLPAETQPGEAPMERVKPPTKKQLLQIQMDKERMLRNSNFAVQPRVNKKHTLSSLLEAAQSKLVSQGKGESNAVEETSVPSITASKPNRPSTIALDDDSEDETLEDVERRKEEARWKLGVSRALLVAPISKDKRLEISRELQVHTTIPLDKRLEVERVLHMSPLSSKIQNLSLEPSTQSSSSSTSPRKHSGIGRRRGSLTSPSKSQRPGLVPDLKQYNEVIKRDMAKRNLERRKQLEIEAKKTGTWKSPEEYAAEQLRIEDKRNKGLDPDEDEDADDEEDKDYDPAKETGQGEAMDDEEEAMELGSADDEEAFSGESEGEEERKSKHLDEKLQEGDEGEGEEEDDDDEDEEEWDEEEETDDAEADDTVKMRRTRKRMTNVIGDEDDVKVVIVDRSQAAANAQSDEDDDENEQGSDSESDNAGDADDDISDIDQEMEGDSGTQGFGDFFESSVDLSKAKNDNTTSFSTVVSTTTLTVTSTHSLVIGSDPSQGQSQSMAGALDVLSGKFSSATPLESSSYTSGQKNGSSEEPATGDIGIDINTMGTTVDDETDSVGSVVNSLLDKGQSTDPDIIISSQKPRNAFDVMSNAMRTDTVGEGNNNSTLRRLQKRAAKPSRGGPISKNDKSAFIEYEAEEEEDEYMGMGGVDYESENDNDDYDLGDGMVDTTAVLDTKDVENVRKLHMKHEQDQHDKDISDLVQGIAAGGLWKRGKGQMDDLDLFDEEDMNGRFHRKKKLKMSEKIEELADNPKTAAYARALRKDKDDDQLVFLSDPDESNDEADPSSKGKKSSINAVEGDDDEEMADATSEDELPYVELNDADEEEEEEEEVLNTDKRKEKFRLARLLRDANGASANGSMESGTIAAMTKGQALPFGNSSRDHALSEETVSKPNLLEEADDSTLSRTDGASAVQKDPMEEYEDILRRKKVIQDIIDGVEDPMDVDANKASSQRRHTPSLHSSFDLMDRVIDRSALADADHAAGSTGLSSSGALLANRPGAEVDVTAIAHPRTLTRQNSSFLSEERKTRFLSTVGEDSRGANAGNRVVKEVNRRRMAFATSTTNDSTSATTKSSVAMSSSTVRIVTSPSNAPTEAKAEESAPSRPSQLIKILSMDE
ncbi:hypothetical protein BGX28_002305 [Mortierella sp. GBA30]|nr:hypothetical protein BGX28_002305 [Mortierella sp. GBA30]